MDGRVAAGTEVRIEREDVVAVEVKEAPEQAQDLLAAIAVFRGRREELVRRPDLRREIP